MSTMDSATSPTPSAEMEMKLLPCPFCGEGPSEYRGPAVGATQEMDGNGKYIEEGRDWSVLCRTCGGSCSLICTSEAEAIAAWNRRPSDPVRAELVEALKPFARIALLRDTHLTAPDMIDAPDLAITPGNVRRARATLARAEAGSPRPTSTRREVLEEAARRFERKSHREWSSGEAAEFVRSLASEGE